MIFIHFQVNTQERQREQDDLSLIFIGYIPIKDNLTVYEAVEFIGGLQRPAVEAFDDSGNLRKIST